MSTKLLRWGIVSTGNIASQFATDLKQSRHGVLQGVASRDPQAALSFCNQHGGTPSDTYLDLLQRDDIDAVYIATPHDSHAHWSHLAIANAKAVLCEKPLGINQGQTLSLYGDAEQHHVLLVEALMYLMHPRMHMARSLIETGAIGTVRGFASSFGFAFPFTPDHRLYNRELAGGSILDIGIYPLTAARYLLGEPNSLSGEARLADTRVDAEAKAQLDYGDFTAHLHCSIDTDLPWVIQVEGTTGTLTIDQPWHPGPENSDIIITNQQTGETIIHSANEARPLYAVEADHIAERIDAGAITSDLVTPSFSINTSYWLDRWRMEAGTSYDADQLSATGFRGQTISVKSPSAIPYQNIKGLAKPVSKLVLGTDNQIDAPTMAAMADIFVEHGGNCFDTAYIYSGGLSETLLGQWIQARNIRDQIVISGKGAHTPDCSPTAMTEQLSISLDRLQSDYLDIYCLHRDNPEVPVSEWIDALNAEVSAGRIGIFGGSNWSQSRIDEANEYAAQNGLQGFALLSNNFSLARMESPVWDGCLASSTPEYFSWHVKNEFPIMAWSSQARGFFLDWETSDLAAGRHGADPTMQELQRVWGSPENMERRKRANQLADKYGLSAIQIALTYVVQQSFPAFAIIGPRTPSQLFESVKACNVKLSEAELAWLDLRGDLNEY